MTNVEKLSMSDGVHRIIDELQSEAMKIMKKAKTEARTVLSNTDLLEEHFKSELQKVGIVTHNLAVYREEHGPGDIMSWYLSGKFTIPADMTNPKAIRLMSEALFAQEVQKAENAVDFDFQERVWEYPMYDEDGRKILLYSTSIPWFM